MSGAASRSLQCGKCCDCVESDSNAIDIGRAKFQNTGNYPVAGCESVDEEYSQFDAQAFASAVTMKKRYNGYGANAHTEDGTLESGYESGQESVQTVFSLPKPGGYDPSHSGSFGLPSSQPIASGQRTDSLGAFRSSSYTGAESLEAPAAQLSQPKADDTVNTIPRDVVLKNRRPLPQMNSDGGDKVGMPYPCLLSSEPHSHIPPLPDVTAKSPKTVSLQYSTHQEVRGSSATMSSSGSRASRSEAGRSTAGSEARRSSLSSEASQPSARSEAERSRVSTMSNKAETEVGDVSSTMVEVDTRAPLEGGVKLAQEGTSSKRISRSHLFITEDSSKRSKGCLCFPKCFGRR
eukprot:TRINITY_DN19717_c0_g1_i1.p1 TRINITY_DN19717_c0_g1~~TRINITY_DN19717_c0_g1_i1.p1  ORF type:complete len:349 (+),score=53.41 TRINITY_DN19717_c0_g1_i1:48-1094(+)